MLRVRLLGELAVSADGRAIAPPTCRRAWALLGYLALHPGPVRRAHVAAVLWPDVLDSSARASLRTTLWELRRALGDEGATALTTTGESVGLAGPPASWTDIGAFDAALHRGCPADAVDLCRGDLLDGIDDEWALEVREAHRVRHGHVLADLAAAAAHAGDHDAAVGWARRAVTLDPLSELATRRLMRHLTQAGDVGAALLTYERLRRRLGHELSASASPQTTALADSLRRPATRAAG
ncbi:MAG: transcriptional activator domain, partial [Solirubrobacterales bacterium]|nr:transcriptional activator domain [Solirubrobacterales bacterium]